MKLLCVVLAFLFLVPVSAQDSTRLGLGFGAAYNGEDFITHINDLGISHFHINIKWSWFEPSPGQYQDSILDAFLNQLPQNSEALIRISTRENTFYNDSATGYTVPMDLSIGSPYYDFVHHIVSRDTAKKVKYYENEYEFNFTKHWGGENNTNPDPIDLGNKYADLTRTTEAAIADANPDALFVLGGTTRTTNNYSETLLRTALANLVASDSLKGHCDYYDQHLYRDLYGIPDALAWYENIKNDYPAFADKPIFCTEYAGPITSEFANDTALNSLMYNLLANDYCILAGDMNGYGLPDHYRMFAYGIEAELEAKRDSIQANNYVQRTLMGLANGVERMYIWSFESKWFSKTTISGTCNYKNITFGKLALSETDYNDSFIGTNSNYDYFKTFVGIFNNTKTVIQDTSYLLQNIYFFELETFQSDTFYVVWEKRDQFYGVYDPAINFSFNTTWDCVNIKNLFGRNDTIFSSGGIASFEINDIPLILSKCGNIAEIPNLSGQAKSSVVVNPNPASSSIQIKTNSGKYSLVIYDQMGKAVQSIRACSSDNIDIRNLSKGLYLFYVKTDNGSETRKIVVR